jgi:hypothetical protein
MMAAVVAVTLEVLHEIVCCLHLQQGISSKIAAAASSRTGRLCVLRILFGSHGVNRDTERHWLGMGIFAVTWNRPALARTDCYDYYSRGCLWRFARDTSHECTCSAGRTARYQERISGPLLDRIDVYVQACNIPSTRCLPVRRCACCKAPCSLHPCGDCVHSVHWHRSARFPVSTAELPTRLSLHSLTSRYRCPCSPQERSPSFPLHNLVALQQPRPLDILCPLAGP